MLKSIDVRMEAGLDLMNPICIYGLCDSLKVKVRFVNINMEGAYVRGETPRILVSALRPLPRRNFTCGHELGHHVFEHGSTVDKLVKDREKTKNFNPEEFLVDSFSGFLLMPTLGVRKAFASRGWKADLATPLQVFTIACNFGVGYETLIDHMAFALEMISPQKADTLRKVKLPAIRKIALGQESSDPLIIADEKWALPTIDAEVGTYLLLPNTAEAANGNIIELEGSLQGRLFRAARPGIVRVHCPNTSWAVFVRISRYQFEGLSQYRHLEDVEDG
jgi:Zn-dependent peptidase ImmA (M78 family)